MKIMDRFKAKSMDYWNNPPVTLAFLGDSITQGCFEVYCKSDDSIGVVFDQENGYHHQLKKLFAMLYPKVPVNIINAGISGSNARHGAARIDADVLCHKPDLVVVCFGLNDSVSATIDMNDYLVSLEQIFDKLQSRDIETIFMTPNMMNTTVSDFVTEPLLKKTAEATCKTQNDGVLDAYLDAAISLCEKRGIAVCDCYRKWKLLSQNGVNITELLANKINHPTRTMNWLFAVSLLETMLE